jgi:arsenite methyltransferase
VSDGDLMKSLVYDRETAARLQAMYTTQEAGTQRRVIRELLGPRRGETILDVGVGPGFLASELAAMGGKVVGLDISGAMLALARRCCTFDGVDVELLVGDCTALPFPDGSFDAVVAVQTLEYVDDVETALHEAARVLRRRGRLLVVETDIESRVWHARDQARASRILSVWDDHAPHPHLPRRLPSLLGAAGMTLQEQRKLTIAGDGSNRHTFAYRIGDLVADYVIAHGSDPTETHAWLRDVRSSPDAWMSLDRSLFLARKR